MFRSLEHQTHFVLCVCSATAPVCCVHGLAPIRTSPEPTVHPKEPLAWQEQPWKDPRPSLPGADEPDRVGLSFGTKIRCDQVKMRSHWMRVGPQSSGWCPCRGTETQTRRGRDWSNVSTSQGPRPPPDTRAGLGSFSFRASGETDSAHSLTLGSGLHTERERSRVKRPTLVPCTHTRQLAQSSCGFAFLLKSQIHVPLAHLPSKVPFGKFHITVWTLPWTQPTGAQACACTVSCPILLLWGSACPPLDMLASRGSLLLPFTPDLLPLHPMPMPASRLCVLHFQNFIRLLYKQSRAVWGLRGGASSRPVSLEIPGTAAGSAVGSLLHGAPRSPGTEASG